MACATCGKDQCSCGGGPLDVMAFLGAFHEEKRAAATRARTAPDGEEAGAAAPAALLPSVPPNAASQPPAGSPTPAAASAVDPGWAPPADPDDLWHSAPPPPVWSPAPAPAPSWPAPPPGGGQSPGFTVHPSPPYAGQAHQQWGPQPAWAPDPRLIAWDSPPHETPRNTFASAALGLALGSLLLPFLAIAAVVCGFSGWVLTIIRSNLPGRGKAILSLVLAMVLGPLGVFVIGGVWANRGADLAKFNNGSQLKAVPIAAPGDGYTQQKLTYTGVAGDHEQTSTFESGSNSYVPTLRVNVGMQMVTALWVDSAGETALATEMGLVPSPALAQQVLSQVVNLAPVTPTPLDSVPGAVTFESSENGVPYDVVVVQRGSVIVVTSGASRVPGAMLHEATALLQSQLAELPPSVTNLDLTKDDLVARKNTVHQALVDSGIGDAIVMVGMLALAVVSTLTGAGRLVARFERKRAIKNAVKADHAALGGALGGALGAYPPSQPPAQPAPSRTPGPAT